jgi:hypothetical protein
LLAHDNLIHLQNSRGGIDAQLMVADSLSPKDRRRPLFAYIGGTAPATPSSSMPSRSTLTPTAHISPPALARFVLCAVCKPATRVAFQPAFANVRAVPTSSFAKGGERVLLQSRYLLGFLL